MSGLRQKRGSDHAMKFELLGDLIPKMTLDAFPEPGVPTRNWRPAPGPNYLVFGRRRLGSRSAWGKKRPIASLSRVARSVA